MIPVDVLASISDDELFAGVQRLTARSNAVLADVLAHLGEVERRGIHRLRACASLYTYCVYELRMSEDAAYRRAKAARLVREYPELHDAIAKGEIHLTGVLMIGPRLGGERHAEILRRARFRSKRELLRLIAEIDPKPAVPTLVEPLGPAPAGRATHAAYMGALAGPERQLPPGRRPEDWLPRDSIPGEVVQGDVGSQDCIWENGPHVFQESADDSRSFTETSSNAPDAHAAAAGEPRPRPLHYKVQFTASQEFVDLLEEVRCLLSHERSGTDLPDVQLRALRALVKELRKKKRVATDGPHEQVASRAADDTPNAPATPARQPLADSVQNGAVQQSLADTVQNYAPARPPLAGTVQNDAPARQSLVDPADTADTDVALDVPDPVSTAARPRSPARSTRYVSASVRRVVFERDACRCAYRDDRGERCRETRQLEIHHRHAFALGGGRSVENLELRCRAHNTLAAEQDFGREHMDLMRGVIESPRRSG